MSAKAIRLVVFDLDGTLVDSSQDLATAVNAALARVAPGASALSLETVRSFIGEGAGRLVARSLAALGIDRTPEEVLPIFLECYRACLLETTQLYPGVVEALDALAPRVLAVLTNKPGDMSRTLLAGLGIDQRFRRIYGGGDLPHRKPDPEGLRRLLEETGTPATQAVMVGDSGLDIRTGRAAGVGTVGVTWGFDRPSLDVDAPDHLIDDMRELPRWLC